MNVIDPNKLPAAVALSSVAAGHLVETADGKHYLVLVGNALVDCATNDVTGLAASAQVYDHGAARVEVDPLP